MEKPDELLRRIALYRRYLAGGVDAELARVYLNEIVNTEAELGAPAEAFDPEK